MDEHHRLSWVFRDAFLGITRRKWVWLLALLFFISMCLRFTNSLSALPSASQFGSPSVFDYFAYLFSGKSPFVPNSGDRFSLPEIWFFQHAVLLVFLSGRISKELEGAGIHILMRCGRTCWLVGKYCGAVTVALMLYLLAMLSGAVVSVFSGQLHFSPQMDLLQWLGIQMSGSALDGLYFFLMPLLGLIAFSVLQTTLELIFFPAISWVAIVVLLSLSAYFSLPVLIGNSTMLLRVFSYQADGTTRLWLLISNVICTVLCVALGIWRLHKMDLTCHKNGLGA